MKVKIHHNFKLNGISLSDDDLKEVGYSLIKEGEVFEHVLGDFLLDWLSDEDHITVQTSGSTGRPKRIALKKAYMVNSALATGKFFNLKAGDSALLCLSTENIAGKMMLVRAMVLGLDLDYIEPSSSPLRYTSRSYDFSAMVPLQLGNSIKDVHRIKKLIVGGAPISKSLNAELEHVACQVYETYGMTETVTHIAVKRIAPIGQHLSTGSIENMSRCFKVLPEVKLSTDDRDCLVIEAPKVSDGVIMTNDMVDLISETEFVWLGRYDNIINSGGVKLVPEQIEAKLEPIMDQRFIVAGLSDEKLGEKLVVLVEGDVDTDALTQKMAKLTTLDTYEVPKAIYGLPAFSETSTGKIQRKLTVNQLQK